MSTNKDDVNLNIKKDVAAEQVEAARLKTLKELSSKPNIFFSYINGRFAATCDMGSIIERRGFIKSYGPVPLSTGGHSEFFKYMKKIEEKKTKEEEVIIPMLHISPTFHVPITDSMVRCSSQEHEQIEEELISPKFHT